MTDAELKARILTALKEHGLRSQRQLKRLIDPPGGERTVRRVLAEMRLKGEVWPRTHYGNTAYGLEPPSPRPQNQRRERTPKTDRHDEPTGGVIVRDLGNGRREIRFGRDWRAGKGLTTRPAQSMQSGLNSVFLM